MKIAFTEKPVGIIAVSPSCPLTPLIPRSPGREYRSVRESYLSVTGLMNRQRGIKILALSSILAFCGDLGATSLEFFTSHSPFNPGTANQGWWTDAPGAFTSNSANYFTGTTPVYGSSSDPMHHRSFFTFDLSLLQSVATGATLSLQYCKYLGDDPFETVELFDVSTDAAALNSLIKGTNAAFYSDLGTGTSYGIFDVFPGGAYTDILNFTLNSDGLADLNASGSGFFSIGAALQTIGGPNEALFSESGSWSALLTVEVDGDHPPIPPPVPPIDPASSVPDGGSSALMLLGVLIGLIGIRRQLRAACIPMTLV